MIGTALVHHGLAAQMVRRGTHTAIVCGEDRVDYAELGARIAALAARLQERGVRPGQRIVVFCEAGIDFAVAVHAVLACGAVFVPVGVQSKAGRLEFIAHDVQAAALVTQEPLRPVWAGLAATLPVLDAGSGHRAGALPWPRDAVTANDLAAILYTSGSTGRPKGVMLTHANMTSAATMVQAWLGYRDDDVIGLALPPTFSYGLYNLLMGLALGATVLIERSSALPLKLAARLASERATVLPGVPMMFGALLGALEGGRFDGRALRLLTNAAAALPEPHLRRLRRALPQAQLLSMYGMTECMRISYLPADEADARAGSVGRGMPGQTHWLVDEHGRRVAGAGIGELVMRGPHVMQGYWNRPDETAQRLRIDAADGLPALHTGDLFRADEQGYLYFVARTDDIIKTRGEKVAPREVEDALCAMPGVAGAAVIGVPDETFGEAIKAFVMPAPGATLAERAVILHCRALLESHMVPQAVEFVTELPQTDSGKVRHAALRQRDNPSSLEPSRP